MVILGETANLYVCDHPNERPKPGESSTESLPRQPSNPSKRVRGRAGYALSEGRSG